MQAFSGRLSKSSTGRGNMLITENILQEHERQVAGSGGFVHPVRDRRSEGKGRRGSGTKKGSFNIRDTITI